MPSTPASPTIMVDRLEDDVAVLEIAGEPVTVPRVLLPPGAVEGALLSFTLAEGAAAVLDDAAARLARLRARTPQGPGTFEL